MKRKIIISGVGCTKDPGSSHIEKSFKELLTEAVYNALGDAEIDATEIDGASFSYAGEGEIGHGGITPTIVDALGLSSIPSYINIANCASAHVAFLQGCEMIESGEYNNVLVAGFDKYTDVLPFENYMLLSTDSLYDYNLGYSHIDSFLLQTEYFRKYNIRPDLVKRSLLKLARTSRNNGRFNKIASFYKKEVPSIAELEKLPFFGNAMQVGEGASAVILSSKNTNNRDAITVVGKGFVTSSHYAAHRYLPSLMKEYRNYNNGSMVSAEPLRLAIKKAYNDSGLNPHQIDLMELYDQGINSFISIEASGICFPGKAPEFILKGNADIDGLCPINTDGGNVARGHAAGGASLYQIIELVKQLQHRSDGLQVENCKNGMSTVIGGTYATNIAVILQNTEVVR